MVESSIQQMPEPWKSSWLIAVRRPPHEVPVLRHHALLETEVWANGCALWLCTGCGGVMLAPWRMFIAGSEEHHAHKCLSRGGGRQPMDQVWVRARFKKPELTVAKLNRVAAPHGFVPTHLPHRTTERGDEGLFPVWGTPQAVHKLRQWDRCRRLDVQAPPKLTSWRDRAGFGPLTGVPAYRSS